MFFFSGKGQTWRAVQLWVLLVIIVVFYFDIMIVLMTVTMFGKTVLDLLSFFFHFREYLICSTFDSLLPMPLTLVLIST